MDPQDLVELQETEVPQVLLVAAELEVKWALLDEMAQTERKENQDLWDRMDLKEIKERKDPLEDLDQVDQRYVA